MKKSLNLLFSVLIFTFILFGIGCESGNGNGNGPDGPDTPQDMSEKHAMQYFIDEDIRLGWNLGNTLDGHSNGNPNETAWLSHSKTPASQALFNEVKALGFDIVRIPCTWGNLIGSAPNYTLDSTRLNRIAEVVGYAENAGLKAIINLHHDDVLWLDIKKAYDSDTDRIAIKEKFAAVWTQIANKFLNYGEWLIFESMNEVHDGDWGWGQMTNGPLAYRETMMEIINEWNQTFTDAVRATGGNNELRFLMYPSMCSNYEYILPDGRMGSAEVGKLWKMPEDWKMSEGGTKEAQTGRQIVTFHYYDPFNFAHDARTETWDTSNNRNNVTNLFARFKTNYIDNDVPVIIGEMGPRRMPQSPVTGDLIDTFLANRLTYINFVYGKARENGIVPVYWDDNGNFRGMNRTTAKPIGTEEAAAFAAMKAAVGR